MNWTLSSGMVFNLQKGVVSRWRRDMVVPQYYYISSARFRQTSRKYLRAPVRKKVTNFLFLMVKQALSGWHNELLLCPNVWIINVAFWIFLGYLFRSNEIINFCLVIVKLALALAVCREKNKIVFCDCIHR